MLQDLMLLSYIKTQWLPYIEANPGISDSYYTVLKLFSKHPRSSYRSLIQNGQLQAAAVVYERSKHLWIGLLISAPYRIKGAGTKLLVRCAKEAIEKGTPQIKLGSTPSAITFYEERGFRIVSRPPAEFPEWDTQMCLSKSSLYNFLERYS